MLRATAFAALVLLPLAVSAHPVPADPHQGCILVGYNVVPTPPPATLVRGLLSYTDFKTPATSTIGCQTPPVWTFHGAEWASHAAPCPPLSAAVTAVPGVYCGPLTTSGTFRCWWDALTPLPAAVGLVVGVDVDLDGRLTVADKLGTPASPTQLAPWVSEMIPEWDPAFPNGGHVGVVNVAFPPGRIMAFPTTGNGAFLDPSAQFRVDCA